MDKTVIEDDILDGIQVRLDNPNWDYIAESLVDVLGREATQGELEFAYAAHDRVRIRMETDDTEYVYRVLDKDGRDASGYNNTTGTFAGLPAATRGRRRAERIDTYYADRGRQSKAPYRIQRAPIVWEDA